MAEESNVHFKLAGAEVLGLLLIAMIGSLIAMYGLGQFDTLSVIAGVAGTIGAGMLLCTGVAYLNENVLVSAAFGLVAFFLMGFVGMATPVLSGLPTEADAYIAAEYYTIFFGIGLILVGVVAFGQPIKILPIFLLIAGLSVLLLGLWFDMGEDIRMVVGVFWLITTLLALYMAVAIGMFVVKGKQVLPLLVKA